MAPKVDGAWNLHAASQGRAMDFFVLFSSVSSLLGSPGQGNHAAANAFLDALAHYRRGQGLPALSINWGAWTEVGAAAARGVGERIEATGMRAFSPEQGVRVLERLLRPKAGPQPLDAPPQVGVMPIDWPMFLRRAAGGGEAPFFAEMARGARGHVAAPEPAARFDLRKHLEEAPPNQRHKLLQAHVRGQAAKVLGLDSPEAIDLRQPLNELGLDSLMAVELRNLLGAGLGLQRSLPATLVFDYPSIADLTDYLAREVFSLGGSPQAARGSRRQDGDEPNVLDQIEQLSEDEVERLFSERLQGEGGG
jgi:acyl carrier protein